MADKHLSIHEAAERLQLSAQRVRALVAAGQIPADKIGGRYILDSSALALFHSRERFPGRPVSSRNAWALLAAISDCPADVEVSRSSYYRLLRHPGGPNVVKALAHGEARSENHRWRVLPSDVARLRNEKCLVLTGLAAEDPSIDIRYEADRDGLDGYVNANVLQELERSLKPERGSQEPNLVLRVPRGSSWILDAEEAPSPVVAADLLGHSDPRVRRAAQVALSDLANAD
jgi:excisionase family DNA binding protein